MLWESKRTKNWSDGWLAKLRDDQRIAKADIAIIVSTTLPKGVETFDLEKHVGRSKLCPPGIERSADQDRDDVSISDRIPVPPTH